jgi:hypothetical protein
MNPHNFVKGGDPQKCERPDPHPHKSKKFDPDPHKSKNPGAAEDRNGAMAAHHCVCRPKVADSFFTLMENWIRIRIKVNSRIRISIKVKVETGSEVLWFRIRIKLKGRIWIRDPHQSGKLDPDQSDKLDPDPHQFADDKPKCKEYEPI